MDPKLVQASLSLHEPGIHNVAETIHRNPSRRLPESSYAEHTQDSLIVVTSELQRDSW
jgi:hypothetical protein